MPAPVRLNDIGRALTTGLLTGLLGKPYNCPTVGARRLPADFGQKGIKPTQACGRLGVEEEPSDTDDVRSVHGADPSGDSSGPWAGLSRSERMYLCDLPVCLLTRTFRVRVRPAVLSLCMLIAGCPEMPGNGSGGTNVTGEIITLRTNRSISVQEDFLSILYNLSGAPADAAISSFYVPVSGTSSDNYVETGPRVTISTGLSQGTSLAFNFVPSVSGVGVFRVGLDVNAASGTDIAEILSAGTIRVEGAPNPVFVQPPSETRVPRGEIVLISIDAGDPENNVQWRIFYYRDGDSLTVPADQLGVQLATGAGNVGSTSLDTSDLAPGLYRLGVSAVDTGDSIATAVARGDSDRIVTNFNGPAIRVTADTTSIPPEITFTAPGMTNVSLFGSETFTLRFSVRVLEPGATGRVDLFYDTDRDPANRVTFATDLPDTTTSFLLPTNIPDGTYTVGAEVRDGVNAPVVTYATGTITIARVATLQVTSPNTSLPIAPSAPGQPPNTIDVAWSTNVPAGAGTVDVFARTLNTMDQPVGPEIQVLAPTDTATRSTQFSSEFSGLFRITVRITLANPSPGQPSQISSNAPQPVRVSSLPRILWLGTLAATSPQFDGAILEGVNFEDNAGASLAGVGDLNGDGLDEFLIGARYGKPFFVNPSGVGPGEAYLIYGRRGANRIRGLRNLNSVGTSQLVGITLAGIPTVNNNDSTDGLSDLTTIPDVDGDGLAELVFGFPRTDSAGMTVGALEAAGQFLRGGVVILSSRNSLLGSPTSGVPVLNLNEVGQRFTNQTVQPDVAGTLADTQAFTPGDPNANPPVPPSCGPGTDGVLDTITGPAVGFIDALAPSAASQAGFVVRPPNSAIGPGLCPTIFNVPGCAVDGRLILSNSVPGSGFYPSNLGELNPPLEPLGARILGASVGDGFGTSLTFSSVLGSSTLGDLIISSPNRTATPTEVPQLTANVTNAGVAYIANNRNLWEVDPIFGGGLQPPCPHQYMMGFASHCGDNRAPAIGALRVVGNSGDRIQNILGIHDFNGDGRNDFAVGAPTAGNGQGRLFIAFRRDEALEGNFILSKLQLSPNDPERLTGLLITTTSLDSLGFSLTSGFDFNGDNLPDLVVGSPSASGGVGEVIILFSNTGIVSGQNGISVQTLLSSTRTAAGNPVAARITGNFRDATGNFGFNIANAGDVDGDGKDDLLIAAPGATPRFDGNVTDDIDILDTPGVDTNFDGIKDDVGGPNGLPDGVIDANDNLTNAGLVYLVSSRNRLDQIRTCSTNRNACSSDDDCAMNETCAAGDLTISIDQLGKPQLRGYMIAGRRAGDRLGGGDAGDPAQGGISGKSSRGRSRGLAAAGDVDGDGRSDILIGAILADPRRDPNTGVGVRNGGEVYLVYGSSAP